MLKGRAEHLAMQDNDNFVIHSYHGNGVCCRLHKVSHKHFDLIMAFILKLLTRSVNSAASLLFNLSSSLYNYTIKRTASITRPD